MNSILNKRFWRIIYTLVTLLSLGKNKHQKTTLTCKERHQCTLYSSLCEWFINFSKNHTSLFLRTIHNLTGKWYTGHKYNALNGGWKPPATRLRCCAVGKCSWVQLLPDSHHTKPTSSKRKDVNGDIGPHSLGKVTESFHRLCYGFGNIRQVVSYTVAHLPRNARWQASLGRQRVLEAREPFFLFSSPFVLECLCKAV